jgi:PPOX class probable F420-dependent enzyme
MNMDKTIQAKPAPQALERRQFINLTTFRKNGKPVVTTVWFAYANGKIYGTSKPTSGKVKRIRNNPQVTFASSTMSGRGLSDACPGKMRLLVPEEYPKAIAALKRKYGLQYTLFSLFGRAQGSGDIYWEITPD